MRLPHHDHGSRGPHGRLPRSLKLGLQRRIFGAFGATIIITGVVVFAVMQLVGDNVGWRRDMERARRFAGRQLAAVWEDSARRRALVEGIADDLDVGITLYGTDEKVLETAGGACQRRPIQVPVFDRRTRARLGRAEVCATGALLPTTGRFALGFCVAIITIWAASGIVARKLSRPLVEVADVAREIGRGRLQSRSRLSRRHHHDEAGILSDALHEAAERIDKQLADQRALLAAVSHEIRTPLARMRLLVELSQTNPQKLAELDREIVDLDTLVGDLLAGARVDFSALKPVEIDPRKLGADVLARENVPVEKLLVEGDVTIEGDATLLSRAVTNLVQNAVNHAGGVDELRIERSDDRVIFTVLDRGPGISPGEETKIFEPFYRRPDTENNAPAVSAGLGLALVRRIAEAHGGRAFAQSREGGGARIGFDVRA